MRTNPLTDGGAGTVSDGPIAPDDTGSYQDAPNTFPQDAGGNQPPADAPF